jgi:hypothetical protein
VSDVAEFTPFPVPKSSGDVPLVTPGSVLVLGARVGCYFCSGCGGSLPQGVWLHETVEEIAGVAMVTGLDAYAGPDGELVHRCGADVGEKPPWQRSGWAYPMGGP